jgi:uncharacterized protein (DUF58 family)
MSAVQTTHPPIAPTRRRPSSDFSLAGLLYCALLMFMGLAAYNTQANLIFAMFGLMIGIMIVSWVVGRVVVRGLDVRRAMPPYLVVGVPTTLYFEITNRKRYWPSMSVTVTELDGGKGFTQPPQAYLLHAAPGKTASIPCELLPRRRGIYELDHYQLSTTFPFGFIKRSLRRRHRERVAIFPPVAEVERRLLSLCRAADEAGQSARARPGGTDEFYGVRQYRSGDNPRWIHWRRSAQTGVLVMREMTRVAPPQLILVVDTYLESRSPRSHADVERAIAMAGSVASAALDDGLAVGLCAFNGEPVSIEPGRGKQQCDDLLGLLSRLPLNQKCRSDELMNLAQRMARPSATIVLATPSGLQGDPLIEARGSQIVLSALRDESLGWFHFSSDIDFEACVPADQMVGSPKESKA